MPTAMGTDNESHSGVTAGNFKEPPTPIKKFGMHCKVAELSSPFHEKDFSFTEKKNNIMGDS